MMIEMSSDKITHARNIFWGLDVLDTVAGM